MKPCPFFLVDSSCHLLSAQNSSTPVNTDLKNDGLKPGMKAFTVDVTHNVFLFVPRLLFPVTLRNMESRFLLKANFMEAGTNALSNHINCVTCEYISVQHIVSILIEMSVSRTRLLVLRFAHFSSSTAIWELRLL